MPAANQDQMLHHLKQWADRTGYRVGSIEDTGNDFILEVTERESFPSVQFIHQRKEHAHLLVVGQVKVPSEDRELLKRTMGEGFKQFIWDLKLSLLNRGVDFVVIGEDDKDPDAWEVHLRIYLKEFDPNLLQSSYTRVKNSLISVIWSYKKALDQAAMFSADPSEPFSVPGDYGGMGASQGDENDPERTRRIMNTMANTGIIMMVTLMDGFAQTMMGAVGAMASGMAEAFGDEETSDQVAKDMEDNMPEAKEQMMGMVSDMRKQLYEQMAQKADEITPLLADRIFDKGPEIVDVYEFGMSKLTEELDDETIAEYAKLLVQEDKYFTEMFGELSAWMNSLPQLPK